MKRFHVIGTLVTLVAAAVAVGCTATTPTATTGTAPTMTESQYVARGKYLVQAADCIGCHSPFGANGPDMTHAFAGGNAFFVPGVSISISQNITPRDGSKIKSLSVDQLAAFFKTMKAVPPMMDLGIYTDEDRKALAYYLKTVTPMPNEVPESWIFAEHKQGDKDWPRRPGMTESTGYEVKGIYDYEAVFPPLTQSFIDQQIASASPFPGHTDIED